MRLKQPRTVAETTTSIHGYMVIAGGSGTGLEQQNRKCRPGWAQPRMVVCIGIIGDIAIIAHGNG